MWVTSKLGETCKMYQPKTITKKEMVTDGKYDVYGANGIIGKHNKYNHEEPQLLIGCRGTCGSVNVSTPFSWINGNSMVIQPDTSKLSLNFMKYIFQGGIDLSRAISGTAQPQITAKSLNGITFFYPPLEEQERIVAKLDAEFAEINKVVEYCENSVSNAKDFLSQFRASHISEMLNSSHKVKLGSLASLKNGLNFSKGEKGYSIKILGVGDFGNRFSTGTEGLQFIETNSPVSTDYHLEHGDIVFVRSNGNKQLIGRSIVIENPNEKVTFSGFCIRCRIEMEDISPVFLCHYLKSSFVRDKLTSGGVGTSISSLNQKMLADIDVPILSESEQISHVRWLEKLENGFEDFVETHVKKFQLLNKLKSAILKQELQPSEAA